MPVSTDIPLAGIQGCGTLHVLRFRFRHGFPCQRATFSKRRPGSFGVFLHHRATRFFDFSAFIQSQYRLTGPVEIPLIGDPPQFDSHPLRRNTKPCFTRPGPSTAAAQGGSSRIPVCRLRVGKLASIGNASRVRLPESRNDVPKRPHIKNKRSIPTC